MNALSIAGNTIQQDGSGRYSLNDLHRAAGGENRHRPSIWVENQQTRQLAAAIEGEAGIPALVSIHGGTAPGTYAARELVYSYAMWISPTFHLRVIRAYDALVTHQTDSMAALSDPNTLRTLLLGYAEKVVGLEQQVAAQAPKVEALGRIAEARGAVCLTDAAKALQMRRCDLIAWLQQNGWIHKRMGTSWLPYQRRVEQGLLVLKVVTRGVDAEQRLYDQALVTPKGLARLAEEFASPAAVRA